MSHILVAIFRRERCNFTIIPIVVNQVDRSIVQDCAVADFPRAVDKPGCLVESSAGFRINAVGIHIQLTQELACTPPVVSYSR
eukprot:scaffold1887_cov267-Chaetoceros_neogracile.AAC.16